MLITRKKGGKRGGKCRVIVKTVKTFCQTSRDGVIGRAGRRRRPPPPRPRPRERPPPRPRRASGCDAALSMMRRENNVSRIPQNPRSSSIVAHDTAAVPPSPPLRPSSLPPSRLLAQFKCDAGVHFVFACKSGKTKEAQTHADGRSDGDNPEQTDRAFWPTALKQ